MAWDIVLERTLTPGDVRRLLQQSYGWQDRYAVSKRLLSRDELRNRFEIEDTTAILDAILGPED